MANWAITSYAIEGPKETLEKIESAIKNPDDFIEGHAFRLLEE